MTLEEIKAYLEANKENADVKAYLDSFKVQPTLEVFKSKLGEPDFKSFMDSEKDKHLTKGIETFKTNNLDALVTAKIKELYPDTDPKDKAIADMKAEIAQMKAEASHKERINTALKIATEKKLPVELVDYMIGQDDETTINNLTNLEKIFSSHVEKVVTERMGNGYVPPSGGTPPSGKNPWSKEHLNYTEQGKILKENPTLAAQLMAQAKN
ncbi:MAG TPA: hypothetical protein DEF42_17090 [Desulfosporosinus sp.]|nr:hypothetical protein [Desulfosporosinus sp.]